MESEVSDHARFRIWGLITGNEDSAYPAQPLNLKPGELVRVKTLSEIKSTLDPTGKNRSLLFAPSMKDFCGQILRVRDCVENILEGTSRQRTLKDTVLLEGATCDGLCLARARVNHFSFGGNAGLKGPKPLKKRPDSAFNSISVEVP